MRRLPTLRFRRLGRVVVLVHGKTPPSEEDWKTYLDAVWNTDDVVPGMRTLVLTDGGSPDALQRGNLTDRVRQYGPAATAVVSGTRKVRLVVTALSWFFSDIKFFVPDDLEGAFAFLELAKDEQTEAIDAALELLDDASVYDWERRLIATKRALAGH